MKLIDVPYPGPEMPPIHSSHSTSSTGLRLDHRLAPPWPPVSLHGHPLSLAWTSSLPDVTLAPFQPMPRGLSKNAHLTLSLFCSSLSHGSLELSGYSTGSSQWLFTSLPSYPLLSPLPPPLQPRGPPPYYLNIPNSLQPQGLCTCYSFNLECSSLSCHLTPIGGSFQCPLLQEALFDPPLLKAEDEDTPHLAPSDQRAMEGQ